MSPGSERGPRPVRVPAPAGAALVDRGARLPAFVHGPPDALPRLQRLSVAVVGLGSIGGRLADGLARLGVGRLLLVDPGRIKAESLLTHDVRAGDVGRGKAELAGERAAALHPQGEVLAFDGPAQALRDADLQRCDLVVLATDNLATEVHVGARALRLGVPLLQASVDGGSLLAQLRSWPNADQGQGPCPACAFGPAEREALDAGTRFACAGALDGPFGGAPAAARAAAPTRSTAALCALAADLAGLAVLRRALGLGEDGGACLDEYAGYLHRATRTPLRRRPDCPVDHAAPRRARLLRPLGEHSPAELLAAVGLPVAGADGLSFGLRVDGYVLLAPEACRCDGQVAPARFAPGEATDLRCPRCDAPRTGGLHARLACAPGRLLAQQLDRPLATLGVTDARLVLVEAADERVLLETR